MFPMWKENPSAVLQCGSRWQGRNPIHLQATRAGDSMWPAGVSEPPRYGTLLDPRRYAMERIGVCLFGVDGHWRRQGHGINE